MSKIPGVVTGQVTSVDDPDKQGRVQVSFPFLGGQNDSTWAPVATLMSGKSRGSWFMPEVGDEVLVAFNQGASSTRSSSVSSGTARTLLRKQTTRFERW